MTGFEPGAAILKYRSDCGGVRDGREMRKRRTREVTLPGRIMAIGKIAPEVEGEDQDGKKFKLSDYQGKVVLLDFWSQF